MLTLLLSLVTLAAPPPSDVLPHRSLHPHALLHAQLLPVGFSPDGKLAVLHLPPDEAIGCFLWSFQIINLVDDKIVASTHWEHDDCAEITDLTTLWATRHGDLKRLMDAHSITPAPLSLRTFPLQHDSRPVDAWLRAQPPRVSPEEETFDVPVSVMIGQIGREKSVGSVSISAAYALPLTWGHEVVGYLKSPYEDRLAVIVRGEQRGWEGPPNIEVVHIFGASLSSGF